MGFGRFVTPFAAAAAVAVGTFAAPALAAPSAFTSKGQAVSYQDGKAVTVPNTLYYQRGKIRLEMAPPPSADGGAAAFTVVLAEEGGHFITMLNPQQKQAMRLEASSLTEVTENKSLQKIAGFKLSEFGKTFRGQSKKVGTESVAGFPCSVLDYKGKDGQFRMWLSDQHDIPLKFTYYDKGKPAFSYVVSQLTLSANLPASSFVTPKGYELTDLSEMLKGMDQKR